MVLTSKKPKKSSQFDGSELKFNKYIKNIKIHLQTHCMKWSGPYPIEELWVRLLKVKHIKLILGLNFFLKSNEGISTNNNFVIIYRQASVTPVIFV